MEHRRYHNVLKTAILAVLILCGIRMPDQAMAREDTALIGVYGRSVPEEAKKLFDLINADREKVGEKKLIWDENYACDALYRAKQISIYNSHTAPQDSISGSMRNQGSTYLKCGAHFENLGASRDGACDIYEAWCQDLHKPVMEDHDAVYGACACFLPVGERGNSNQFNMYFVFLQGSTATGKNAGELSQVSLYNYKSRIKSYFLCGIYNQKGNGIDLTYGEQNAEYEMMMTIRDETDGFVNKVPVDTRNFTITSDTPDVIRVDGKKITPLSAGDATLRAVLKSKPDVSGTVTFSIERCPIEYSWVTQKEEQVTYTGSFVQNEYQVKDPLGRTLKEGTDYTLSYAGNTSPGYARAIISGIGNYRGTVEMVFSIIEPPCSPSDDQDTGSGSEGRSDTAEGGTSADQNRDDTGTGPGTDLGAGENDPSTHSGSENSRQDASSSNGEGNAFFRDPSGSYPQYSQRDDTAKVSDTKKNSSGLVMNYAPGSFKARKKGKRKILVTLKKEKKKLESAIGYEIQIAYDREFRDIAKIAVIKKTKTRMTFRGKRKKIYYIRVRYYNNEGYSKWSRVRKVRTR